MIDSWVPVIIALIAALPGILAYTNGRRKQRAEATQTLTDTSLKLVGALNQRIDELERESMSYRQDIATLKIQLTEANHEIDRLKALLQQATQRIQALEKENSRLRALLQERNQDAS